MFEGTLTRSYRDDVVGNPGDTASGLRGEPAALLLHDTRQDLPALGDSVNGGRRGAQDAAGPRREGKDDRSGEVGLREWLRRIK